MVQYGSFTLATILFTTLFSKFTYYFPNLPSKIPFISFAMDKSMHILFFINFFFHRQAFVRS